ncbi:Mitochondrial pyruvate carrier 2 [Dinochytrium kinnereticum]|nr:Mitochondrial pyruvate carrier 2 [Dinochytrium kinnereticum]
MASQAAAPVAQSAFSKFWNHPAALAATGIIWSRYSMVITPVNYNLMSVNLFVGATGIYQLFRIWSHEQAKKKTEQIKA